MQRRRLTCHVSWGKVRLAGPKGKSFSFMFHRFAYESKYYSTLSRVPLAVRMKLDVTGTKISLKDWLACDFAERAVLCHLPIESADERRAFVAYMDFLSRRNRDRPVETTAALSSTLWGASNSPAPVIEKSASGPGAVTFDEWARWRFHERYALYKTATSTKQPEAFAQLLAELRASKNAPRQVDD
jgi:hypothetical protein